MYDKFGLVLMVTRLCDLRCGYCYVGRKSASTMSAELGRAAIDRAVRSIRPDGKLELGFFGGEPLVAGELLLELLAHADRCCRVPRRLTAASLDEPMACTTARRPGK